MQEKSYKLNFNEMKAKVGVTDVALALGYRLDKKAGVGRYAEFVLTIGDKKADTIVVMHPNDRAKQIFFRRNGTKGDVVSLIKENITSFNVPQGGNIWLTVANVMAQMANMPISVERQSQLDTCAKASNNIVFDSTRYKTKTIENDADLGSISHLLYQRGFNYGTIRSFAPFIQSLSDTKNCHYKGGNVAFPYVNPAMADFSDIKGYEIRGHNGFKSKAAGTDSSNCCWIAVPAYPENPEMVCRMNNLKIYLAESAFDAMAFYQQNRFRFDETKAVFVSFGGTFSDNQLINLIKVFPEATFVDCFDNDLTGRSYAVRMAAIVSGVDLHSVVSGNDIRISSPGMEDIVFDNGAFSMENLKKHFNMEGDFYSLTPPVKFKDWNDCIIGEISRHSKTPSKFDRNENLAAKRRTAVNL